MATLILLMGLPCSGKTTYAKNLQGISIELDYLRKGATGSFEIKENLNDLVHHLAQRSVHFYLNQGKNVIVDGHFLTAKERKLYITMAKKMKYNVEIYWFDVSYEVIKRRILNRNEINQERQIDLSFIEKMAQSIDFPTLDEGINQIHYVSESSFI